MLWKIMIAILLASLGWFSAWAADDVVVGGVPFAEQVEQQIGDRPVTLALTGAGVRDKYLFSVYAIASYAARDSRMKTAQQLAGADSPKCLHLVMLRGVSGKDMADAFLEGIRLNYAAPALQEEADQFVALVRKKNTQRGDHVWLRHVPGTGLECDFAGELFLIKNVELARAVWNIYFGPKNISEKLKRSLTSSL